jgi:hypothetical protein
MASLVSEGSLDAAITQWIGDNLASEFADKYGRAAVPPTAVFGRALRSRRAHGERGATCVGI